VVLSEPAPDRAPRAPAGFFADRELAPLGAPPRLRRVVRLLPVPLRRGANSRRDARRRGKARRGEARAGGEEGRAEDARSTYSVGAITGTTSSASLRRERMK